MMESIKVVRKLFHLAEVLVVTTEYSKYCHTIYEASAEIERLEKELAAAVSALEAVSLLVDNALAQIADGEK